MSGWSSEFAVEYPEEMIYDGFGYMNGVMYSLIDGYTDYYITSEGDVISFRKREPRYLSQWANQHGHLYVQLRGFDGRPNKLLVHRLMGEAFIPNPENYPIVRHLNDIPYDNHLENLAWGTPVDNREDCVRNGHDFTKPVYCFELDKIYRSGAEAARELNASNSLINKACRGKNHTVNGYHICYAEERDEKSRDYGWLNKSGNNKSVVAIDGEGRRFIFNSRKEAARKLGVRDTGITNVLTGRIKRTGGWIFEEGE